MLTLTVRHDRGCALAETLRVLRSAWRAWRQRGEVARAWRDRVRATVRAWEITYGDEAGWHAHLHVLVGLRGAVAPPPVDAWCEVVERIGGARYRPDREHGARWSAPREDVTGAYVAKIGWEVTSDRKDRSVWRILAEAPEDPDQRARWEEYVRATRGLRAIEMDDRATAASRAPRPLASDRADAGEKEQWGVVAEIAVVEREELRLLVAYERAEPRVLTRVLEDAVELGARAAVDLWLGVARSWYRGPGGPANPGLRGHPAAGGQHPP